MRNLSLLHAALADQNRLRLLNLIKDGELCVCHLQHVLQTNQPRISRHLAYLKKAGLVGARREGKWIYYHLKKPENGLARILAGTLACLRSEQRIKNDAQRLKQACCFPERYGINLSQKRAKYYCK